MRRPFLLILFVILFSVVFSSCDKNRNNSDDTSADHADVYSESAEKYLEQLFGKDVYAATSEDYSKVTCLNIVGDHITTGKYDISAGFDSEGYIYENKQYAYNKACGNDLSFLADFTNLTELGIYYCPSLGDVSFISEMPRLAQLTIVMTNITELKIPSTLHELTTLYVEASPVETVEIGSHNHLDTVHFINGNLTDVSFISSCSHIRSLTVSFNKTALKNTELLSSLTDLHYLDIHAPDTDFSFLSKINAQVDTLRVGGASDIPLMLSDDLKNSLATLVVYSAPSVDLAALDSCISLKKISLFDVADIKKGSLVLRDDVSYRESKASLNFFSWWKNDQ